MGWSNSQWLWSCHSDWPNSATKPIPMCHHAVQSYFQTKFCSNFACLLSWCWSWLAALGQPACLAALIRSRHLFSLAKLPTVSSWPCQLFPWSSLLMVFSWQSQLFSWSSLLMVSSWPACCNKQTQKASNKQGQQARTIVQTVSHDVYMNQLVIRRNAMFHERLSAVSWWNNGFGRIF